MAAPPTYSSLQSAFGPSGGGGGGGPLDFIKHLVSASVHDAVTMGLGAFGAVTSAGEYPFTHSPEETLAAAGKLAYQLPVQAAQQFWTDVQHPLRDPLYTAADIVSLLPIPGAIGARAFRIGAAAARGGALPAALETATRPLLAAGDYAGAQAAAKALGREAEFTRAVKPSGPVSFGRQFRTELLTGAPAQQRVLKDVQGNPQYGWWYSRDPTIRAAQKLTDRAYTHFEGTPPWPLKLFPPFTKTQAQRAGKAARAQQVQLETAMGAKGMQLWKKWGQLPDAIHLAARMVLEGTTPKVLRDFHQRMLDSDTLNNIQIAETHRRLPMIDEAAQYLDTKRITLEGEHALKGHTFEVPVPKDGAVDLQNYVNDLREMSQEREYGARLAGVLSPSSATTRNIAPLHFMLHNSQPIYEEAIQNAQRRFEGLQRAHPDDPNFWQELQNQIAAAKKGGPIPEQAAEELIRAAGLTRVHYDVPGRNARTFVAQKFRKSYKGQSRPAAPSTFTHPFEAGYLKGGGGDPNVARVMAASYSEAARYIALRKGWERILGMLQDTPEGIPVEHRRLVKRTYKSWVPTRDRAIQLAEGKDLSPEDALAEGLHYDSIREDLFPAKKLWGSIRKFVGAGDDELNPVAGYGWIDDRLLGGLDKQNPLLGVLNQSPVARKAVNFYDAVNTSMKLATLYLHPAYILPNTLGNVALNLIQQGFLAPWNIARSVVSWKTMKKETRYGILRGMGEGGSTALTGDVARGVHARIQRGGRAVSRGYGKIVDEPFRMSSFLHEARQAGYSTQKELDQLVLDPAYEDQFHSILQRANDEIINYAMLNPSEQAILRRAIFFYPWIKGSTRYTLNLAKEHPIQAGMLGTQGRYQAERTEEALGPVPKYLEGIFPSRFGTAGPGQAIVQSAGSLSPISSAADALARLANTVQGPPSQRLAFSELLAPADRAFLSWLTAGGASGSFKSATEAPLQSSLKDQLRGLPLATLYSDLFPGAPGAYKKGPYAIYPPADLKEALIKFFATGALEPRAISLPNLHLSAYYEGNPRG